MPKIAVLVSGGGTNLQAILDSMKSGQLKNTEIKTVISNRKNAFALQRAQKNGVKARCIRPMDFDTKAEYTKEMIRYLDSLDVELIVLAGFLLILDDIFIKHYKNRIINIHPSLIPAFAGDGYYGLKIHEKALARGVKITGATVHVVDEITDHGPILYQHCVEVLEGDTPEILQQRVMEEAEWILLPKAISEFDSWSSKLS